VYLAALRAGDGAPFFTAASRVEDLPITVNPADSPGARVTPRIGTKGSWTVRQALEQSAQLGHGPHRADRRAADRDRIGSRLGNPGPARAGSRDGARRVRGHAAGAARAYLPLANGGVRPAAMSGIRTVQFGDDEVKPSGPEEPVRVVSPAEAWLVTSFSRAS